MSANQDVATTTFTYLAIEKEIRDAWSEIEAKRKDLRVVAPIRDWELYNLFEIHNKLDVESTLQQERHLKFLMESLNLQELNCDYYITGGLKAHVKDNSKPKTPLVREARSVPYFDGFIDPAYSFSGNRPIPLTSEILIERKREINKQLIILSRKRRLTREETMLRKHLIEELKGINRV